MSTKSYINYIQIFENKAPTLSNLVYGINTGGTVKRDDFNEIIMKKIVHAFYVITYTLKPSS